MKKLFYFVIKIPVIGKRIYLFFLRYKTEKIKKHLKSELKKTSKLHNKSIISYEVGHEITLKCNLKCKMCYQAKFRTSHIEPELPYNEVVKLYDKLPVTNIGLVGSEIFMYADIYRILRYLDERQVNVNVQTNGTLFNDVKIRELKEFKNIACVMYSIDGPEKIHDKIRGVSGAYSKTIDAIKKTVDYFNIGVNTVILDDNMDYLPEIIHIAKSLGLRNWNFTFEEFYSHKDIEDTKRILKKHFGWNANEFEINVLEKEKLTCGLETLKAQIDSAVNTGLSLGVKPYFTPITWFNNINDYYNGTGRKNLRLICSKIASPSARIDHKGNVLHCGAIRKSFGNLLEHSLDEIWHSREYSEFRKKMLDINLLPICKRCCKAGYV